MSELSTYHRNTRDGTSIQRSRACIGLIGHGDIGQTITSMLMASVPDAELGPILVSGRTSSSHENATNRFEELLERRPDVVIECAGQQALREYGPDLLANGINVVAASVGALTDSDTFERFSIAVHSSATASRLIVPSGAIAGLDAIAAARLCGTTAHVRYTQIAPSQAFPDVHTESGNRALVFRGSARDAAQRFPHIANVTAAIAFAGLGLDHTVVEIHVDQSVQSTMHIIRVESRDSEIETMTVNLPMAPGAKSSRLVAGSCVFAAIHGGFSIQFDA